MHIYAVYVEKLSFLMKSLTFLIFLFLELLAIEDSSERPRSGARRGEIWAVVAFKLSNAAIQLLNELERMSRGMTLNYLIMKVSWKNTK